MFRQIYIDNFNKHHRWVFEDLHKTTPLPTFCKYKILLETPFSMADSSAHGMWSRPLWRPQISWTASGLAKNREIRKRSHAMWLLSVSERATITSREIVTAGRNCVADHKVHGQEASAKRWMISWPGGFQNSVLIRYHAKLRNKVTMLTRRRGKPTRWRWWTICWTVK